MAVYDIPGGENIFYAAEEMVRIANQTGEPITATFNKVELSAQPGADPDEIVQIYKEEIRPKDFGGWMPD